MKLDQDSHAAQQDQQRRYYAERASIYDRAVPGGRTSRCHYNKMLYLCEAMRLEDSDRVLEIGVGTGVQAAWLMELQNVELVGVDLSPDMIDLARERLGGSAQLKVCGAEELPFETSSFDAAYCCATLHHVADKPRAICEMARVVKAGGRVAFSEPNILNPLNMRQWMFIAEERGQLDVRLANIRRWFDAAGLDLLDFGYLNFTPPTPRMLSRLFDRIDHLARRIPVLRAIGSVVVFTGQKRA